MHELPYIIVLTTQKFCNLFESQNFDNTCTNESDHIVMLIVMDYNMVFSFYNY